LRRIATYGTPGADMVAHCKSSPEPKLTRAGLWQQEIIFTIRLPLNLREDLAGAATRMGVPSSILMRKILTDWLLREGER
jgi:hypothetical protein